MALAGAAMSGSDEVMSLAEWARAQRVLSRAFEHAVWSAHVLDRDVVLERTDREWREAYEKWRPEADI